MKCASCGAEIRSSDIYCSYCGSEVFRPRPASETAGEPHHTESPKPDEPIVINIRHDGGSRSYHTTDGHNIHINVESTESVRRESPKNRLLALLLCAFFGELGAHRFYMGKYVTGVLYLFSFGGLGLGWFIDILILLLGNPKDGSGLPLTWKAERRLRALGDFIKDIIVLMKR